MISKFSKLIVWAAIPVISGCLGGANNGMYGNNGAYNNGQYGNNGAYGNNGGYNAGAANTAMGGIEMAVISAIIQSMAGSVLNGQIGSQLAPADKNFRLQQLGSLLQAGSTNQAQQWINPQTGNTIAVNPVGQLTLNPQTQQKCQTMEEILTLQNGQRTSEQRLACQNAQTGKWNFVQ